MTARLRNAETAHARIDVILNAVKDLIPGAAKERPFFEVKYALLWNPPVRKYIAQRS
jgi:hypothetical protein